MSANRGRQLAAACIVAAGFCFLAAMFSLSMTNSGAAKRDYIGYWAAGQQLARGANPYDAVVVLRLEQGVGLGNDQIKLTPSPPVALALVVPLGFLGAKNGLVFWSLLQMACLALSLWILWMMEGRPPNRIHLFGFLFAPAAACIMAGQLGIFCLLGAVLFLRFHASRPWLAGAALLPCSLKPHLFLPLAIVLLLWTVRERAFRTLGGLVAAMAASDAIVWALDRRVWEQYSEMLRSGLLRDRFSPTLSAYLRWDIAPGAVWIEYSPMALACVWAAWYFWQRRQQWTWSEDGLAVFLVSLMCAPYAWLTDEAVLLPAVLSGVYRAREAQRPLWPIFVFGGAALLELAAGVGITSWYYTWTTPAWLAWYLYATRMRKDAATSADKTTQTA